MAVYVDAARWRWLGLNWCHLLADSLDELHDFAQRIGQPRYSFQSPPWVSFPHYDLAPHRRRRALKLGAIETDRRTIVIKARGLRAEFEAQKPRS